MSTWIRACGFTAWNDDAPSVHYAPRRNETPGLPSLLPAWRHGASRLPLTVPFTSGAGHDLPLNARDRSSPNADSRGSAAAAAISRSPLLGSVAPNDLRLLLRGAKSRPFRARQVLFRRGDEPDGLYIVASGQIRITIEEPNGADLTLATFGAGEMLGELSVLDGTRRSATAVATTAVEALFVSIDDFRRWLTTHPDAAWHVLAGLARRMRATDEQIAEIALLSIETRIARRLWEQFTEVAGGSPRPGLRLRLNQVAWASTLGASRESINKQLARLRTAGVIESEGRDVVLLLPDSLRFAADVL
jgi:CRP/FNR family transcriptional regulator, cyclic AMP receptor protein